MKGGDAVIEAVGKPDSVEVTFGDEDMKHIAGIVVHAARYIPSDIKALLKKQDLMEDVRNTLYMAAVEWWRQNKFNSVPVDKRKEKVWYKDVVRHTWRILYHMLRDCVPQYKRRYYTKFMDPVKLKEVEAPGGSLRPFSLERDLSRVEEA